MIFSLCEISCRVGEWMEQAVVSVVSGAFFRALPEVVDYADYGCGVL